jgi:serine protease SohB
MAHALKGHILTKKQLKAERKDEKKKKKETKGDDGKRKIYVLQFEGDIKASRADELREEVSAILTVAQPADEVVAMVESPGGVVHGYGFAASQLQRLRDGNVRLVVAVDKVAASGGYMMACVAHQIIAAPFAIVGSIGVLAQVPNVNRLLKKFDVDYKEYTAGEFKKTVSLLGEITPQGESKFREQLEETHQLFKAHVLQFRPQLQIEKIATGEYWYGEQAITLGLVDKLQTSDDYLMAHRKTADILSIRYTTKKSLSDKLSEAIGKATLSSVRKLLSELAATRWG